MSHIFYKELRYDLEEKFEKESLSEMFDGWTNGKQNGELRLLNKVSEDNLIYRLVTSKEGVINVEFLRKGDKLEVIIKEQLFAFFPTALLCFLSFYSIMKGSRQLALIFGLGALFFFGIICIGFLIHSGAIKNRIENILMDSSPSKI